MTLFMMSYLDATLVNTWSTLACFSPLGTFSNPVDQVPTITEGNNE
jgi:hypothetical protein